jgi:hypothetical protein
MSFLQPLLLFGLPLALIPLLIHLLNRLRYRSVKWGAIMFILKANRSSTSMARIKQWLILMLRIAAIFALILALARPMLGGWLGWKFSGEPDTVIILLDRSASMGAEFAPGKSKLQQAVNLISTSGSEIASSSRIVLIDSASLKVHEIPSWDILKDIEETTITQTSSDFPAMYRTALKYMVNNPTGTTEIWAASDMQQSNWNPENSEWAKMDSEFSSLPQSVTFRVLAVNSENLGNRSIALVELSTYPGKNGKQIREIVFEITNSSDIEKQVELPLQLNEQGLKRQLTVKTTGPVTRIRHILENGDENKNIYGYISLPPDSNIEDNAVFFGFAPKKEEQTVIISEDSKTASILGAASAPEGPLAKQSSQTIRESELPDTNIATASLVICQVSPTPETLLKLRSFAMQGGVVLFLPPSSGSKRVDSIWHKTELFKKGSEVITAEWNRKDGPLADTISGEPLPVDTIKLKKRSLLKDSDAMPVALCSDGKPFLYAEQLEKGMIYYCTTLPLPRWSNLGNGIVFVPMLRRLAQKGATRLSNIIFGDCGLWKPEAELERYKLLLTDRKENSNGDPAYNTGIFAKNSKIVLINRPSAEDRAKEIDDSELKTLFPDNQIRMFHDKNGSNNNMQSGIWRIFLLVVIFAMILEAYLCAPKGLKDK